ncbi:MAG: cupin domain-containing protein [Candidatus Sulfobium sp.]
MSKIQARQKSALSEGSSTPGITRHIAFEGEGYIVVRARSEPGIISGWHHHGDYDVYGYIVSGSVRFESGPAEEDVVSLGPGDFFHVPANTIHREINPSEDEKNEMILFLHGTGPLVVNVDDSGPGLAL